MGPGGGPFDLPPGAGSAGLWVLGLLALVALMVLASLRIARPRRVWAGLALLLLLVAGAAACNSTYINPVKPITTSTGTPPGVYTVVISAKSTNFTRTISTNLAVN